MSKREVVEKTARMKKGAHGSVIPLSYWRKQAKEELEGITQDTYDRWASGSRAVKREITVDPETEGAVLRAFPKA